MAVEHSLTRRSALAGLGAGSIGLLFGASATASPSYVETGGIGGGEPLSTFGHELEGRWLSMLELPSATGVTVAVPTFLGADGTAVMIFPGVGAAKHGVEIQGVALGCWASTGQKSGHFTVVQVLADLEGGYIGTATVDGDVLLDEGSDTFQIDANQQLFTIRDRDNAVIEQLGASAARPMRAFRMRAGNAGFPEHVEPLKRQDDPRTPD